MRYGQQVANDFYRNCAGKVFDQISTTLRRDAVQQAVNQHHQTWLQIINGTARQRAHDQLAHACVQWRVIEDQAVGVVLVQGRITPG